MKEKILLSEHFPACSVDMFSIADKHTPRRFWGTEREKDNCIENEEHIKKASHNGLQINLQRITFVTYRQN
jgi:hypothetical protein